MRDVREKLRRAVVFLAAAATVMSGPTVPAFGSAPPATDATPQTPGRTMPSLAGVAPGSYSVTLITGDRVGLTVEPGGQYSTSVVGSKRVTGESGPDGLYVIPEDALPAVRAGRLDRELFNVSYLVANGYSDKATNKVPVLVTYPGSGDPRRGTAPGRSKLADRVDKLPGTSAAVGLSSINGAGVDVTKKSARKFWSKLSPGAADGVTVEGRSMDTLGEGVGKVWLNRKVKVNLAESVPLIGAPAAWQSGFDGSSVTVAVLDTGVDANHPDLEGKIVDSKSFVNQPVADGHGHGTHVAATIAGSGAASDGTRKGVAPGADLMVGKVLNNSGSGTVEAMIAGMEWAASNGADIVSMSLGSAPTDGTDVASMAVNELTARTGTLFVIAAGNSGPNPETVNSPGTADAALTVAATDKSDRLAAFSSRGPRKVNLALKPDIAAPGVQITAARAEGTSMGTPVDEWYTTASGTSMATPHVAGAAAILAQRHPDWQAAALKAALMSTSRDVGGTVYETGAGRVDVARAVAQQVHATTANLDFGVVKRRPGSDPEPVSEEVTYRNQSDHPVTLTLTTTLRGVNGDDVADGALTSDDTVAVPAEGATTVSVKFDGAGLKLGTYTGSMVATDEATGVRLSTPVGVHLDERVTLTIKTLGRDGKPVGDLPVEAGGNPAGWDWGASSIAAYDVTGVFSVKPTDIVELDGGIERVQVRPGNYVIHKTVKWWDDRIMDYRSGKLIDSQVSISEDTIVTLDARKAEPVTWRLPDRNEEIIGFGRNANMDGTIFRLATTTWDGANLYSWGGVDYLTPTEKVTAGGFNALFDMKYANSQLAMRVRSPQPMALHPLTRHYADDGLVHASGGGGDVISSGGWVPFPTGKHTLQVVDAGFGDPEDLAGVDLKGKIALLQWGDNRITTSDAPENAIWTDRVDNVQRAGAVAVLAFPNQSQEWKRHSGFQVPAIRYEHWSAAGPKTFRIPLVEVQRAEGIKLLDALKAKPVTVDVDSDPNVRYRYNLMPRGRQQVPADLDFTYADNDLARVEGTFHAAGSKGRAWVNRFALPPGWALLTGVAWSMTTPKPRLIEYYGPLSPDTSWARRTNAVDHAWAATAGPRVFDRPARSTERWNAGPVAPGVYSLGTYDPTAYPPANPDTPPTRHTYCVMCRYGDSFMPYYQGVRTDGFVRGEGTRSNTRMFTVDGTEVPLTTRNGLPVFNLPGEAGRYRLEDHDGYWADTTWTFSSKRPDTDTGHPNMACLGTLFGWGACRPEPFVYLRYDMGHGLNLDNTVSVKAGGTHRFSVTAYHGPSMTEMPAVTGMKLWSSVDGGKTWAPAVLRPDPDDNGTRSYKVVAKYPHITDEATTVSLKAEAWDADGNRIEQTMLEAYTVTRA